MNSRELKFAMVNEAHVVQKWRNAQPEGRAAGLPPGSERLWLAFGLRAAELAHVAGAAGAEDSCLMGQGGARPFWLWRVAVRVPRPPSRRTVAGPGRLTLSV